MRFNFKKFEISWYWLKAVPSAIPLLNGIQLPWDGLTWASHICVRKKNETIFDEKTQRLFMIFKPEFFQTSFFIVRSRSLKQKAGWLVASTSLNGSTQTNPLDHRSGVFHRSLLTSSSTMVLVCYRLFFRWELFKQTGRFNKNWGYFGRLFVLLFDWILSFDNLSIVLLDRLPLEMEGFIVVVGYLSFRIYLFEWL